jgi:hypothetical protein
MVKYEYELVRQFLWDSVYSTCSTKELNKWAKAGYKVKQVFESEHANTRTLLLERVSEESSPWVLVLETFFKGLLSILELFLKEFKLLRYALLIRR